MYIDLLPINGKYRGVTRYFRLPSRVEYRLLQNLYERYLTWVAKQDDTFCVDDAEMLVEFCKELNKFEVICYSDLQSEYQFQNGFLGFDVLGIYRASALEDGNDIGKIGKQYSAKLNENGLFLNLEDALEFCEHWRRMIASSQNPFEVEVAPHPFGVWVYYS